MIGIWGTTWAAIRINLEGFPPLTGLALRFGIAGLLLTASAGWFGVRLRPDRREAAMWAVQTVLTFGTSYGLIYWAEQWVPSGLMAVLFSTFPLWTLVGALVLLPGERVGLLGWLGALIGFGGIAVIFSDDLGALASPEVRWAATIGLLAPLTSAFGNLMVKRWGKGIHPLSLTAPPMFFTGLLIGTIAVITESDQQILPAAAPILAMLYLAVFGSAVTFTIYFWMLARVTVTALSLITFAIPVVAVVVGTLALDEPLTTRMVAGSALVIVGVGCALKRPPRKIAADDA